MDNVREEVDRLLSERPELKDALTELLSLDEDGTWEFSDTSIESGQFGEIVSRDIVEKNGDKYQLVDHEAVRRAIDDGEGVKQQTNSRSKLQRAIRHSSIRPSISRTQAGLLTAALSLVVALRILSYGFVFREQGIVLLGNDPYYYLYWVDSMLGSYPAFDVGSFSELPGIVRSRDPLLIIGTWWATALVGGGDTAAKMILSWYPVGTALLSAAIIYHIGVCLTADRRVGLAAVALLATVPSHAYRTSLGFADHHALDYLLLAIVTLCLVKLAAHEPHSNSEARTIRSRLGNLRAGYVVLFALAVVGQLLSWRGAPLMLLPLGPYVVLTSLIDVSNDRSPIESSVGLLIGFAIAFASVFALNSAFGFVDTLRTFTPLLLLGGSVAVLLIAEAAYRYDVPVRLVVSVEAVASLSLFAIAFVTYPSVQNGIGRGLSLFENKGIAENVGIFSSGLGTIFGAILTVGLVFFLAAPVLGYLTYNIQNRKFRLWSPIVVYGWYFLLLSLVRIRFIGQFALLVSLLGGVGFVYLAYKLDVTNRPQLTTISASDTPAKPNIPIREVRLPDRSTTVTVAFLFLLISGFGLIQTPIKQEQLAVSDESYRAGVWMDQHAAQNDWEYPQNYVLSQWGNNRMYNSLVHDEYGSYGYAREQFPLVLSARDPSEAYRSLERPVGFVVFDRDQNVGGPRTLHSRLFTDFGSATDSTSGVGHFRALWQSESESLRVFSPVPGARITGRIDENETVSYGTEVTIPNANFTYTVRGQGTENGFYSVTVPYPGTYAGPEDVSVDETAVQHGHFLTEREPQANWSFDAGRGDVAFDSAGGNHGVVTGAEWVSHENGSGLSFDSGDAVRVRRAGALNGSNGLTVTTRFRSDQSVDYNTTTPRLLSHATQGPLNEIRGYQLVLVDGQIRAVLGTETGTQILRGPFVADGEWHRVSFSWNGSQAVLHVDGERISRKPIEGDPGVNTSMFLGSSQRGRSSFVGTIDEVRVASGSASDGAGGGSENETQNNG